MYRHQCRRVAFIHYYNKLKLGGIDGGVSFKS